LFNYTIRQAQEQLHFESNDLNPPIPYFIFLSGGGGGVGKSHTVKGIIEYLKRHLKFKDQNVDEQPSVLVCASTWTAAVKIKGQTLHSAFNISRGQYSNSKLSNDKLNKLQRKCAYLKNVIHDEISMTGNGVWNVFEERLRKGKKIRDEDKVKSAYGDVSILAVGDFFQLPPVTKDYVFYDIKRMSLDVFTPHIWKEYFYLHELTEIVRQQGDPRLAEVMSHIRTGDYGEDDIEFLNSMTCKCCKLQCKSKCQCECTCTSDWPIEPITLYFTNKLAEDHNTRVIESLGSEIYTIRAKDSSKDEATHRCLLLNIDDTGNLPTYLKICVGTRIMITVNLNIKEGIANGTLGCVVGIRGKRDKLLKGEIYVKFDNPEAGNSEKIRTGKFKGAVPIKPSVQTFQLKQKSHVIVNRTQNAAIPAHGITIHKSQAATYDYMVVDFDRSTRNEKYKLGVQEGQLYTALSRGTDSSRMVLKNFDPSLIKVNKAAKVEMERFQNGRLLRNIWNHPLENKAGCIISILNIRSWNLHLKHFLCDPIHQRASDIFCFTETHIKDLPLIRITELTNTWSDVFKNTAHGLAFCYNNETINFICQLPTQEKIEMMASLIEYEGSRIIVIIVYRPETTPAREFMDGLVDEIDALPSDCRKVIVGDFNLDLRLISNHNLIDRYAQQLNMLQKVDYSTHIYGGILDLVFDTKNSKGSTDWMPTPFSDHFIIYYDL
jgi:ATP-dependent DNA helicase PIF1